MKKILLFIFIVAFGLSSCTIDEPIEQQNFDAISFRSYVSNPTTRAAVADLDLLKRDGFVVRAYKTGARDWVERTVADDFMGVRNVEYRDDGWDYGNTMYWPDEEDGVNLGQVTFFAHSNIPDASKPNAGGAGGTGSAIVEGSYVEPEADASGDNPKFDFLCHEVCSLQVDLLGDMLVNRTKAIDGGEVRLEFDHLLSKIGFSAKLEEYYIDATVKVTDFTVIRGAQTIHKKGTYTYGDDSSEPETAKGSWEVADPAVADDYLSALIDNVMLGTTEASSGTFTPTPLKLDNNISGELVGTTLNAPNMYYMLIPQTVADGDLKVDITYTVESGGNPGDENYSISENQTVIDLPVYTWEIGKQYLYSFKITLTEATFDKIIVDDWVNEDIVVDMTPVVVDTRAVTEVENSYIIPPRADRVTRLSFPVVQRVNGYWGTTYNASAGSQSDVYPYGYTQHPNAIVAGSQWFAEVIWADFDHKGKVEFKYDQQSPRTVGDDLTLPVEFLEVSIKNVGVQGNLIVGLKKLNTQGVPTGYLWSWHIWITDFADGPSQTFVSPSGRVVMDRNLGARTAIPGNVNNFGFLYQWGRKDPTPSSSTASSGTGGKESTIYNTAGDAGLYASAPGFGEKHVGETATIDEAIANPLDFYAPGKADWVTDATSGSGAPNRWNNVVGADPTNFGDYNAYGLKTIFDPSPAGWRLPWGEDWHGFTNGNFVWNDGKKGREYTDGGEAGFFPAAGLRHRESGIFGSMARAGLYWSGTPSAADANNGHYLHFTDNILNPRLDWTRPHGYSVRLVKDIAPPSSDKATTITYTETANSYIVAPTPNSITLAFPAVERSNEYWGYVGGGTGTTSATYPYGYSEHANKITNGDNWYAEVIWADFDYKGRVAFKQRIGAPGNSATENLEVTFHGIHREGNIVIGIKKGDGSQATEYLWSWHIWISDVKAKVSDATAAGQTFQIDARGAGTGPVTPAIDAKTVLDRNLGATAAVPNGANTNTFGMLYQWGRKDAFPPSARHNSNAYEPTIYTSAGGAAYGTGGTYGNKLPAGTGTVAQSINNPLNFYGAGAADWVVGTGDNALGKMNRWNYVVANLAGTDVDAHKLIGTKTIFDPCPPGWRIPWGEDWSGFTATTFPWSVENGITGRTFEYLNKSFFFPASGRRYYNSGALSEIGTDGFGWGASPSSTTNGHHLSFAVKNQDLRPGATYVRSNGFPVRPVADAASTSGGTPSTPPPPPTNLVEYSVNQVSNSYIVPETGVVRTLRFPAIQRVNEFWRDGGSSSTIPSNVYPYGYGNHKNAILHGDVWFAEVIWADFAFDAGQITIKQTEATPSNVIEHLEIAIAAGVTEGNFVVGIKKLSGASVSDYLWSWHVWISDVDETNTFNLAEVKSGSGVISTHAKTVMDRNLGARTAGQPQVGADVTDTYGFHYQWGRKDAFPTSSTAAAAEVIESFIYTKANSSAPGMQYGGDYVKFEQNTIANSIANPLTYYASTGDWIIGDVNVAGAQAEDRWGSNAAGGKGAKSIFDPCPVGWRVPWNNNWTGFSYLTNSVATLPDNFQYTTENGVNGRTFIDATLGANNTNAWFPAAGYRYFEGAIVGGSAAGGYRGATPHSVRHGYNLYFTDIHLNGYNQGAKSFAMSIRPVREVTNVLPPQPTNVQVENKAANSYIVPFGGTHEGKTVLSFPAVARVNQFWNGGGDTSGTGEYPYGFTNHENKIGGTDSWYAEVIWADFDWKAGTKVAITQNVDAKGLGFENLVVTIDGAPQGNVVIGLKKWNSTVATEYLWSWHIWISDIHGRTANTTNTFDLATGSSGAKKVMDRNLGSLGAGPSAGTEAFGLFYQWGRKDAFPGAGSATANDTTEPRIWNTTGATAGGLYDVAGGAFGETVDVVGSIVESINNPLNFYGISGYMPPDWVTVGTAGEGRFDRWQKRGGAYSAVVNDYDGAAAANKGTKSIFDPCPPGWRLPTGKDWNGFPDHATGGFDWSASPAGRTFTTAGYKGWFPAAGYRNYGSGAIENVSTNGYYWSASPGSATSGCYLSFNGSGVNPSRNYSRSAGLTVRPVQE